MKPYFFLSDPPSNRFWDPNIMNAIDGIKKAALSNGNLIRLHK